MKKFSKNNCLFFLLILLAMSVFLKAQAPPCGFDAIIQAGFQEYPNYEPFIEQNDLLYSQNPTQGQGPADGTYEIPTVVHIIHNNGAENISDEQVMDAIVQANIQLAGGEGGFDTKIQLVLAKRDPNNNCTSGINRVQYPVPDADVANIITDITIKNLSRWPVENYLNIWIVRNIVGGPGGVAGYSYMPGVDPLVDGIVLKHTYTGTIGTATGNQLNTLVHEFGHYISLYHVWGSVSNSNQCAQNCHIPSECLGRGDRVCDTNTCLFENFSSNCDPYLGQCAEYNCPNGNSDVAYPKENYMSYNHACQYRFTEGQAVRMHYALDNNRENLWSDENQWCTGIAGYYAGYNLIVTQPLLEWTSATLPAYNDIFVNGTLTIESGSTLNIGTGKVVHFCKNGKLVIKPNARLNLYGTLTNSCDEPWKGIEVWGNSTKSQFTQSGVNSQGRLVGYAGSVIENADIGVQLWGPDYFANAGGMVSCNGTTFRNNRRAAEFAPYTNFWPFQIGPTGQPQNYSASFGRCTFVTDDGYLNSSSFEAFLYMTGVKGINISGSTFTNDQNISASSVKDYGYGIYASDAGFNVRSACNGNTYPCMDYTHSTFNKLGYGVYTANVVGNQPFNVQRARFNDCYFGIYNKAVSQGTVLFNEFNFGNVPDVDVAQDQFGTFFEAAMSGFTFQENNFVKTSGTSTPINTIGSYCKDLGYFDGNLLRRNTYNGVDFGNVAEMTNAYNINYPPRGLHYLCNTNTGVTMADLTVLEDSDIRTRQGLLTSTQPQLTYASAGNKFSQVAIDIQNLNTASPSFLIRYFRNPAVPLEDPVITNGLVNAISANPNACPSDYCNPPCKDQLELVNIKSDYFVRRSEYNTAKTAYDGAIASGNMPLAEQKGGEMSFARQVMDESSFMVILHLLYDTTTFHRDSLLLWLGRMDNPAAHLQQVRDYLANGQPIQAGALLSQAVSLFEMDSEDAAEFSDLSDIVNLIGAQSVYSLNAQTLNALDSYTNGNGSEAAVLAQNIKSLYGNYYPPQYIIPRGGERSKEPNHVQQFSTAKSLKITASPNPASGEVIFAIEGIELDSMSLSLRVTDLSGKTLWSQQLTGKINIAGANWNTMEVSNGIYAYHLTTMDGQYRLTGKIVILK